MSGTYKFFLVLHLLASIIGFGAVFLNALYGAEAKRRGGQGGLAVMEANTRVSDVGQYVIYAVPLLGFALVGLSDDRYKFSQTWVWLSLVLYLIALGIIHGMVRPNVRRMNALAAELTGEGGSTSGGPPPQVARMEALGRTVAAGSAGIDLLVIVILFLMVYKPGGPG